jgi:hypothetical protein
MKSNFPFHQINISGDHTATVAVKKLNPPQARIFLNFGIKGTFFA